MKLALAFPLVAALIVAGCLNGPSSDGLAPAGVASSADAAGGTSGPAPSAPQDPYQVTAREIETGDAPAEAQTTTTTAFPVNLETNAVRPPVRQEFKGMFNATECSLFGNVNPAQSSWRAYGLADLLQAGDVYSYKLNLTWTNTDESWGEIHLLYGIGTKQEYNEAATSELRGAVSAEFSGQGYRVNDDDQAWAAAACWYGMATTPIEYTLTVDVSFAANALPAETPVLVQVPDNATRLLVSGVSIDPAKGVLSHYRVFDPDDNLVCECALSTADEAASIKLAGPGAYVVLVDHTDNGFVSLALDAPSPSTLRPLDTQWVMQSVHESDGGPVAQTVEIDIPTVPLVMFAFTKPTSSDTNAGLGKQLNILVTNDRGTPLSIKWAGLATYQLNTPTFRTMSFVGLPFPGGSWEYTRDHHAYGPGKHSVSVAADFLRGEVLVGYLTYVRVP